MFKIRNTKTGQYSTRGYNWMWGSSGKIWYSRQALQDHLRNCRPYPPEAEVVMVRIIDVESFSIDEMR